MRPDGGLPVAVENRPALHGFGPLACIAAESSPGGCGVPSVMIFHVAPISLIARKSIGS